jgi:hypothetical protein
MLTDQLHQLQEMIAKILQPVVQIRKEYVLLLLVLLLKEIMVYVMIAKICAKCQIDVMKKEDRLGIKIIQIVMYINVLQMEQ